MSISLHNDRVQFTIGETTNDPQAYRCHIAIVRDDADSFSAIVLNLPGAGSCGPTEEEALDNAREAVAGVIEQYLDDGVSIPWHTDYESEIPENSKLKWILVHV